MDTNSVCDRLITHLVSKTRTTAPMFRAARQSAASQVNLPTVVLLHRRNRVVNGRDLSSTPVPMADRPATPPPMTNTFAGGTLPAAVICPVKNLPKWLAVAHGRPQLPSTHRADHAVLKLYLHQYVRHRLTTEECMTTRHSTHADACAHLLQ